MLKKTINRIKLQSDFIRKRTYLRGHPIALQIEVTNYCNFNCYSCPRENLKRKLGYMDYDLYKKIINENKDFLETVLLFHMGEPLLHKDIAKMVAHAKSNHIKTVIFTNGYLLTEENAIKLIDAKLDLLVISFDGIKKETYETVRAGSNQDVVLNNISCVLKQIKLKNSKLKIQLHFVVSDKTQNELKEFTSYFKKVGIKSIRIKPLINTGGISKTLGATHHTRTNPCMMLWREPVIGWDGTMFPCCVDLVGEKSLGHLDSDSESVMNLWNSKSAQLMRANHKNKKFQKEKICFCCNAYETGLIPSVLSFTINDFTLRKLGSFIDRINANSLLRFFNYIN